MKPFYCNNKTKYWTIENESQKVDCIVPPVEQWLKSFADAKMVITDSFHGVVFSIIFNKPFWVVINKNRGASRFYSILRQFNLENRIVTNLKEIVWDEPIDWKLTTSILHDERSKSLKLLSKVLEL